MNPKIKIESTNVFKRNWDAVQSGKYRYIINQGASRTSKTVSLLLLIYLLNLKNTFRGTVWREKRTWAKATVYNDLIDWYSKWGFYNPINHNKSDLIYKIGKSTIEFNGMDDYMKVHGLTQDWAWFNEALEINRKEFDQIDQRTSKFIFIDFNPLVDEHWIYDLAKQPNAILIKSLMKDNPFIPEAIRKKILSYEPTPENIAAGTADKYNWTVYGLGEKAKREGLVFPAWEIKSFPEKDGFWYGLDFGYTNDPTAIIKTIEHEGAIYFDELLYRTGLTNREIAEFLYANGYNGEPVICDSAEPKSIDELKLRGINAYPAAKGPGSIMAGIDFLKSKKVYVSGQSVNLIKENKNYQWKLDREGKPINQPKDWMNHAIDACRYAYSLGHYESDLSQTIDPNEL